MCPMERVKITDDLLSKCAKLYKDDGYFVIENFLCHEDIELLKDEVRKIIKTSDSKEYHLNGEGQYHEDSARRVDVFYEKKAFDENHRLLVPREQSYAKIAHGIHALNPLFKKTTTDPRILQILNKIEFVDPVVVQGMFIFKNPTVGMEYNPHQDASFLITEPTIALGGCWIAIDDATLENGCLEFVPGSHKTCLKGILKTNKNRKKPEDPFSIYEGTRELDYKPEQFVKVPVKAGTLVVLHGCVVHRSNPNLSDKSRWIYTFHFYDASRAKWSEDNWLKPGDYKTFLNLSDAQKESK